jgi:myo-inositol-1(or 4)-monophosphatase
MNNVSPTLNVMISAARKAGRSLVRDFGEVENLQVSIKGPANFVSAADHKAEDVIFKELSKSRGTYGFLMEERGEVVGADKTHRWIVDPLDGTTNFLHSNPMFAVSIGLEREGQLVAGVIYNPVSDELFTAEKGKGAYMNDRRLRVAARKTLGDALVTTGIPHRGREGHPRFLKEIHVLMGEVAGIRRTGSAALDLAFVAAGRFDAYWEHNLKAWDVAAGIVIVREAGGFVSDLAGGDKMMESGDVLAANATLHKAVGSILFNKA